MLQWNPNSCSLRNVDKSERNIWIILLEKQDWHWLSENSWENFYYSDSTKLGRQSSYGPTFKMCNRALQLKYYRKILWSWKKHGLFTTCSTAREREGTTFTPCFIKTCTHLGATCFHSDASFTSKPSHFPLLNHCVTVNHWWSSALGPKIGLGAEKGWGRDNLSCVQLWLSQATVSPLFYL